MASLREEIESRRTFAIISHPDAGKTTLTEKLLLYGGAIQTAGSVKGKQSAKHAVSDWMDIEKQRGISVTSSVLQFNYQGKCINILDTPGHQDFSEDTYRVLVAADAATGRTLWTLPTSDVNLGASISYAIDGYGTMYIGGYYGPDPVAVSREGEVLWQANTGREDIYWLYKIELDANDGVIGTYDAIGDGSGRVCFGWNGEVAWISAN